MCDFSFIDWIDFPLNLHEVIQLQLYPSLKSGKELRGAFRSGGRMETSSLQTQYLGHVFIDKIFRFRPPVYIHMGPFPVMPHVATPKRRPDSREALFWLDSRQMLIPRRPLRSYDFPYGADLVSFRETWHPSVNGGGGWDYWNRRVPCGMRWTCLPQNAFHILSTFNLCFLLLFFFCLSDFLCGFFIRNIPAMLPLWSSLCSLSHKGWSIRSWKGFTQINFQLPEYGHAT